MVTWDKILKSHGKMVSLEYGGFIYPECEIYIDKDKAYFMNNTRANNDMHPNRDKYYHALLFTKDTICEVSNVKFLDKHYELW